MPVRQAKYGDLLPASKILAAAFFDDPLFGAHVHPLRHEYPDDMQLFFLRMLRINYCKGDGYVLLVSFAINDETGLEDHVTGMAYWYRRGPSTPELGLISKASMEAVKALNAAENYIYPNRAIDNAHALVLLNGRPYIQHHWTGTRENAWYLGLLAVDPTAEKRGYGRDLVRWGLERSRKDGIVCSVVSARGKENFYRACGFDVEVGNTNDEGGQDNPYCAAMEEGCAIFFCDNGIEPQGIKKYGET